MTKSTNTLNYLDMVPLRNVTEFTEEENKITLLVPKFKKAWMQKWLIPGRRSKHIRVRLDEMGSKVWRLIDGQKNTGEICDLLKENENEDTTPEKQIEPRVTQYLSQLYKHRLILFKE